MTHSTRELVLATITVAVIAAPALAQTPADLAGHWEGRIAVGDQSIRLVFRVDEAGQTVMDSPDQGARGIPVQGPTIESGIVRFLVPAIGGRFEGTRSEDGKTLTGVLSQGGVTLPLVLSHSTATVEVVNRPQTPKPPFPYRSEDVTIDNPAAPGVQLGATLTLPEGEGPFPAAVLITGTGPQDRDETILDHKPFAIWADALTRRGIAVLRYDDRGVARSTGDFSTATGVDFASDAKAAFDWLKTRPEIDPARTGMIGHSEGGVFAPIAVEQGATPAWMVMLAGPAASGAEIIQEQQRQFATAAGVAPEAVEEGNQLQRRFMAAVVANAADGEAVRREVTAIALTAGATPDAAARVGAQMSNAWYRGYIAHDPADSLRTLRIPLLAVYGEKDLQVPASQNAPLMRQYRPDAEVVVLPGLNHLFQPATTGLMTEYGEIETTLDPSVVSTVVDWVVKTTARHL